MHTYIDVNMSNRIYTFTRNEQTCSALLPAKFSFFSIFFPSKNKEKCVATYCELSTNIVFKFSYNTQVLEYDDIKEFVSGLKNTYTYEHK